MIFKTERLTLRQWKEEDAECLFHFAQNPKVGPIAGWPPHESVEESLNIIKTVFSKKETYAIVLDDIPIGCVGLLFHPDCNHYGVMTLQNLDIGLERNIGEMGMQLKHQNY